jgi:hypothetical protein
MTGVQEGESLAGKDASDASNTASRPGGSVSSGGSVAVGVGFIAGKDGIIITPCGVPLQQEDAHRHRRQVQRLTKAGIAARHLWRANGEIAPEKVRTS